MDSVNVVSDVFEMCICAVYRHAGVHKSYSNVQPAVQSSWPAAIERNGCKCMQFLCCSLRTDGIVSCIKFDYCNDGVCD